MGRYVALLRGINVGGRNMIKMAELKACFEKHGFRDVATYIQSGNVLFSSARAADRQLSREIEQLLTTTFAYEASVVLRTRPQLEQIVRRAPRDFGANPAKYRYDVLFLKSPLTASVAVKTVPVKPGVDRAHAGSGVLYYSRLVSAAAQSRLSRLVSLPIYQQLTVRNWNTTTKLLELMAD
jgi:uncharacterized protein (DUF1697 family)